tara:strand:+ start:5441 stop:5884 length:444 start_codon:yes stop_codon:yes gene_type:complete
MKLPAVLLSMLFLSTPAFAGGPSYRRFGHKQTHFEEYCYKNVERYVPGYYNEFGQYVGGYVKNKRKRISCGRRHFLPQTSPNSFPRYEDEYPNTGNVDNNSCIEGSILGGILGGGAGAAASRGNGRLWAIPLGIVGGAMVGCQVDGG